MPRLRVTNAELRENLMRVGLIAVSHRVDGCISASDARRIRRIVEKACWPDGRTA